MFLAVRALGAAMGASVATLAAQVALGAAAFALLSLAWCKATGNPYYAQAVEPMLRKASAWLGRR